MTTGLEFKKLALIRLKSAKNLIDKNDWEGAGYFMGLSLECALKACTCKTLRISDYPESHKDKKVPDFFMTHSFLRLLLLSGLSDIFNIKSGDPIAFANWSDFTILYPGEWMTIRYNLKQFNSKNTNQLYNFLFLDNNSIIKTIRNKRRW
jgi:hypothetical protein